MAARPIKPNHTAVDPSRRGFTAALGAFSLLLPAWMVEVAAHTPYQQWQVYRRRHLIIGTSREEQGTYTLGKEVAAALASLVPESNARVTRARTVSRLASLISTDQLKLVLACSATALELYRGTGRFAAYGGIPLRILAKFDKFLLLSRADFPKQHAWIIAHALLDAPKRFPGVTIPPPETATPPLHAGVLAAAFRCFRTSYFC